MARSSAWIGSAAAPLISASAWATAITAAESVVGFQWASCLRALSICQGGKAKEDARSKDFTPLPAPETLARVRIDAASAEVINTGSVPVVKAWRRAISASSRLQSSTASATVTDGSTTSAQIASLITKINALAALIAKIQKKLGVK